MPKIKFIKSGPDSGSFKLSFLYNHSQSRLPSHAEASNRSHIDDDISTVSFIFSSIDDLLSSNNVQKVGQSFAASGKVGQALADCLSLYTLDNSVLSRAKSSKNSKGKNYMINLAPRSDKAQYNANARAKLIADADVQSSISNLRLAVSKAAASKDLSYFNIFNLYYRDLARTSGDILDGSVLSGCFNLVFKKRISEKTLMAAFTKLVLDVQSSMCFNILSR